MENLLRKLFFQFVQLSFKPRCPFLIIFSRSENYLTYYLFPFTSYLFFIAYFIPISFTNASTSISDDAREAVMAELRASFRPEFLNRLDETILFRPLTKENLTGIIDIMTEGLKNRLMAPALQVAPDVRKVLEALSSVPVPLVGFSMTGSGSACFGLCRTHEEALKNAEFLEKNCAGTVFTAESELAPLQILRTG